MTRSTAKLANAEFVRKAPAEVVEKERARLAEWEAKRVATAGKLEGLRKPGAHHAAGLGLLRGLDKGKSGIFGGH
ncbi:MAG: hypothetical protein OD918_06390 [Gammaproteobacteria bacterium]